MDFASVRCWPVHAYRTAGRGVTERGVKSKNDFNRGKKYRTTIRDGSSSRGADKRMEKPFGRPLHARDGPNDNPNTSTATVVVQTNVYRCTMRPRGTFTLPDVRVVDGFPSRGPVRVYCSEYTDTRVYDARGLCKRIRFVRLVIYCKQRMCTCVRA